MIGTKRNKSKARGGNNKSSKRGGIKHKSLEDRLKNVRNDEEIMSESEGEKDNLEDDEFFEGEGDQTKLKRENADEKRLRLAKKLISKIQILLFLLINIYL